MGCDVNGEKKFVIKGKKNCVSMLKEGFFVLYLLKFVLCDFWVIMGELGGGDNDGMGGSGIRWRGDGECGIFMLNCCCVVNMICWICWIFINFLYDWDFELEVFGIDVMKYLFVFKKLKWDELVCYLDIWIFYVVIWWSKFLEIDEFFEVIVDVGECD